MFKGHFDRRIHYIRSRSFFYIQSRIALFAIWLHNNTLSLFTNVTQKLAEPSLRKGKPKSTDFWIKQTSKARPRLVFIISFLIQHILNFIMSELNMFKIRNILRYDTQTEHNPCFLHNAKLHQRNKDLSDCCKRVTSTK